MIILISVLRYLLDSILEGLNALVKALLAPFFHVNSNLSTRRLEIIEQDAPVSNLISSKIFFPIFPNGVLTGEFCLSSSRFPFQSGFLLGSAFVSLIDGRNYIIWIAVLMTIFRNGINEAKHSPKWISIDFPQYLAPQTTIRNTVKIVFFTSVLFYYRFFLLFRGVKINLLGKFW